VRNETAALVQRRRRPLALFRSPVLRALWADKPTVAAVAFLILIMLATVFAPVVAPHDPDLNNLRARLLPPWSFTEHGNFLLGSDPLGRDVLTRILYGGRVSLSVGIATVLASGCLGTLLGLMAGYFRGFVDDVVMRAVDIFMALPTLLFVLVVLFVVGGGVVNLVLVLAIARWMLYCRVVRGVVLSLREQPFVEAGAALGASHARIMLRHILPNLLTPLLTVATLDMARVMLVEASLSFLGLGVQPPHTSWGQMVAAGRQYVATAWWQSTMPGLAIFLTALSFNMFGTWFRAITDPLQRWRWMPMAKE
jgi:peptide/nickel transport system permease protein